ncbi:MAG: enoyl-CoA hydratase-related protein [Elusimicrobiota bacterium]
MNDPEKLILIQKEGGVAVLTLNRPHALNALNHALMDELEAALDFLEKDVETRCVIVTGGGKAFAAGADIKEMENASAKEMASDRHLSRWDKLGKFPKPTIAAVSGFALGGGCEMALACDLIVASETAVFGQPEILIGVIPGAGGTVRLAERLGKARALELVLTGRRVGAKEALSLGLVNRVVPPEALLDEAKALAQGVAALPPLAAAAAKASVLHALNAGQDDALAFERRLFCALFDSQDQKEGMKAFVEKRAPRWTGK